MKTNRGFIASALVIVLLIGTSAVAQITETSEVRSAFSVRGGVLVRGQDAFTFRAIDVPGLLSSPPAIATLAPPLNRISAAGGNTICFDLYGLSADGHAVSQEGVNAVAAALEQITWRKLGAVCRVFGADAPKDAAYRLAAAQAAASAFKTERRMVYWIEGADCAELVKAFKKEAPKLVVAAAEGGDLRVVTSESGDASAAPLLLAGALPKDPRGSVHFVLPPADASYTGLDAALADPIESQPWTPDPNALSEAERADGWTALFDGKSLDGWWVLGKNKEGFAVRNGAIEWQKVGAVALMSRDRYKDFILRLEWKIADRGNSGVFLRAPRANRSSKIGMEFQLQGDYGDTPVKDTSGAIYDVVPPLKNAVKPSGEWNAVEITVHGSKVKALLNGELVQDIDLDTIEELKYRLREGFIGLQDHNRPIGFRNIRIKKL